MDEEGRECIFDILCEDERGEKFLVEVQNAAIGYIRNRMVYYACRLVDQMGEQGKEWKYDIKKVYSICLMNFTYETQPALRRDFLLCEPGTENILSDKLHFIMLQLPCLEKADIQDCESFYEKLLYLLIQMKTGMKTIEELKQEVYDHGLNDHIREVFLGVLEDADVMSLTPKEREIYDARLKRYRDNRACLDYAIEKGVREGLEKGQQEEKLRIAKSMKEKHLDSATIAQCTNLTIEQVEAL
jgi:predicted transposase/invertase (TIGR01784 family)